MKKSTTILMLLVCLIARAQMGNHVDRTPVPKGDIQITYEPISYNKQQHKKSVDRYEMEIGQDLDIISTVHGSVGISVDVYYDESQFSLKKYLRYHNPESIERGLCGGDEATKTFKFTPLKVGIHRIVLLEDFREDIVNTKVYEIVVLK